MEKRVFAKFTKLNNVVGRVDYISNPKRQENLLGFYQTPEDPAAFWRVLSQESQDQAQYNKAQIEEHNRIEREKFKAGEIKTKHLWSTVEARENILCLPNDVYGQMDPNDVARILAEDVKARLGIECAVGVHLNKAGTNFHAHIIMPERRMLPEQKISIATRNTYFDSEGKRSSKKACIDQNGDLKPGCRMVRKGEILHQRSFSEKNPLFSAKGFAYSEKIHFAEIFNQWSKDRWVVYDHRTNPHLRLISHVREEPEGLREWKDRENERRKDYNTAIDKMLDSGEITMEQALQVKKQLYAEQVAERQARAERKAEWLAWYAGAADRRAAWRQRRNDEWTRIRFRNSGGRRSIFELVTILGLTVAGVDVFKNDVAELGDDMIVRPPRQIINIEKSRRLQYKVDQIYRAAGRKPPSEILAEKKVERLANGEKRHPSLMDQIGGAEALKEKAPGKSREPKRSREDPPKL